MSRIQIPTGESETNLSLLEIFVLLRHVQSLKYTVGSLPVSVVVLG